MTKADIVEGVYERLGGFSKKEAAAIVETILDVIKDSLVSGEKVKISSFGSFTVRAKRQRMGEGRIAAAGNQRCQRRQRKSRRDAARQQQGRRQNLRQPMARRAR